MGVESAAFNGVVDEQVVSVFGLHPLEVVVVSAVKVDDHAS